MDRDLLNSRITIIKNQVRRIWMYPVHPHYTDHGIEHGTRVCQKSALLARELVRGGRPPLNWHEEYILLAAGHLHDIGMQCSNPGRLGLSDRDFPLSLDELERIREYHNELTYDMIIGSLSHPECFPNLGLIDDEYVEYIAEVARGHTRTDLSSYPPLVYVYGEPVRLKLLVALLRFADELDIDQRRVDTDRLKSINIPLRSKVHWWKHCYVSGVEIVDGRITIYYSLPKAYEDRPEAFMLTQLIEMPIQKRYNPIAQFLWDEGVKTILGESRKQYLRRKQQMPREIVSEAQRYLEELDPGANLRYRQRVLDTGKDMRHMIPQFPSDMVSRNRILGVIRENLHRKYIVICSGAGAGKSVLLAQFAESLQVPYVFYRFEQGEQDAGVFLMELIASLQERFPTVADELSQLVSVLHGTKRAVIVATLLGHTIRESSVQEEMFIILDDFHWVYSSPNRYVRSEFDKVLHALIANTPGCVHFIIASRSALPIYARNRKTIRDVGFNRVEATTFLRESCPERRLSRKVLDFLYEVFNGSILAWKVVLELLMDFQLSENRIVDEVSARVGGLA